MTDLTGAQEACLTALDESDFRVVAARLGGRPVDPAAELGKVTVRRSSTQHLEALAEEVAIEPCVLGRWLLIHAALANMREIPAWKVAESVKRLWAEDVLSYAKASDDLSLFSPSNTLFREMARIVTLRRWPAGQFHGELAALPRSYALRTSIRYWPKLLAKVGWEMHGFGPLVETHLNARRKNRLFVTEREGLRSYLRLARSVELRPEIKGVFACSWLYCASTGEITPHLAWLREFFLSQGAFCASIGPAPTESGFLTGSEKRSELFKEGRYRPTITYVVWPRHGLLEWARQFPEQEN